MNTSTFIRHTGVITLALTRQMLAAQYLPQPECVSAFGTTVCGFSCKAAYGVVRCAKTPMGVCESGYGNVVCGYQCASGYGQVSCASSVNQACSTAYGRVNCE